jgi:hypothetical protein
MREVLASSLAVVIWGAEVLKVLLSPSIQLLEMWAWMEQWL